jgi:signal transduction histidine kinase
VDKLIAPEQEALHEQLREVREIANTALERARSLSQMLHPPILDDYGLEKSIEWYVKQFEKQSSITVHYERTGTAPVIGGKVAIHVYRVVQESLTNISRHAGVTEAWVRARYSPVEMTVEVEDKGKGFSPGSGRPGMGLAAMRERAELLGGSIEITGRPDEGALIRLCVPLERVTEE